MRANRVVLGLVVALMLSIPVSADPAGAPAPAYEVTSKGVTVAQPWVRATPAGATVGAAFMEIRTAAGVSDKLISAASPAAGRLEIHTHIMDGNVMKMRRVEMLDLKDGDSRALKPMGDHVMFFDLKQPLKEGDKVKIQLTFEKAGMIEVEGSIEAAGAMTPRGSTPRGSNEQNGKAGDTGKANGDQKTGHEHGHH